MLGRLPTTPSPQLLIEFTPLTAESHVACCMLHGGGPLCCGFPESSRLPYLLRSCCSMMLDAAQVGETRAATPPSALSYD